MAKKKGKGWYGEKQRHSEVAKKGSIKKQKTRAKIIKDSIYEKDIKKYREFNEKIYDYRGTFRTKKLAEQDIEYRLKNIDKPVEVMFARIIPTSKGYRVYARYDDTIESDMLRELGYEMEEGQYSEPLQAFMGYYDDGRGVTAKRVQKLIDAGYITKRVGKYEIFYKPTKKGKEYTGYEGD